MTRSFSAFFRGENSMSFLHISIEKFYNKKGTQRTKILGSGYRQLRPDHQLFILRWYIPRTRKWHEGLRGQVYTIYFFRITIKGFQFTFCIRWSNAAHLFSMPGPGDQI